MSNFIPTFDFHRVVVAPWTENLAGFGWAALMAFLIGAACGLVGNYLILRRLALMGDAVSHSVLPGLVIAFLFTQNRGTWPMFLGALAAGIAATVLIEIIHKRTRVKQDSAIGIAFSTLFAIGVVLTSLYADKIDLDPDCVLYGELATVSWDTPIALAGLGAAPTAVARMAAVLAGVIALLVLFYKELLVSSFDAGLARSLGINPAVMHYGLMAVLSIVVVSSFEAVGAILVIAMLILPGATAAMLSNRLPMVHLLAVGHAALSALVGVHLAVWLDTQMAAAVVVAGAALFGLAWIFAPREGLLAHWRRGRSGMQVADGGTA